MIFRFWRFIPLCALCCV